MSDLAAYLAAAVLVALAAWVFALELRGGRHPIRWAGLAFALLEGCSLALLAPGTVGLGHAGVDGLSVIALGDTVRTAALSFLMLLACLLNPRPARRRSPSGQAAIAVSVQVVMVLLFVAAQPTLTTDGYLVAGSHGRWPLAARAALFAAYAVWALVELFIALLPQARLSPIGPLRRGVRLILAAVCVGVVWSLWSYDDIVRVLRYGRLDGSEDTVSNILGAVCATLVVAAALVGKGSVTFGATTRWVRLCRCYLMMGPLWSALHQAMPQIAFLEGGRPLFAGRPAGIEFALYRRVIEIHDGRLVLRAYHHPAVTTWLAEAGQVGPDEAQGAAGARRAAAAGTSLATAGNGTATSVAAPVDAALLEAATIATALENMRHGRRFAGSGEAAAHGVTYGATYSTPTAVEIGLIPTDLDAEVQWLSQVAWAFRHSPVIPELLERLRAEEG
jgi:hypothetical protein